jgi:hypothetical protein
MSASPALVVRCVASWLDGACRTDLVPAGWTGAWWTVDSVQRRAGLALVRSGAHGRGCGREGVLPRVAHWSGLKNPVGTQPGAASHERRAYAQGRFRRVSLLSEYASGTLFRATC